MSQFRTLPRTAPVIAHKRACLQRKSAETSQHGGLVQGDVIGLVALDFVLRLVRGGTVNVALVIDILSMDFDDFSAHPPGFRIPAHVIADFECLDHCAVLVRPVRAKKPPTEAFGVSPADPSREHCRGLRI